MMELSWVIVAIILIAWATVEVRRYIKRADENVERELIEETNEEWDRWLKEIENDLQERRK